MNQIPATTILALCEKYGPLLNAPPGLTGSRIMEAIAMNESGTGYDCKPRYEESYNIGGENYRNEQVGLVSRFGRDAAYSYGAWQIMPVNAMTYTPQELLTNPEATAKAFVAFFNRYVIGLRHAATLGQIAQVYNSGHISNTPDPGVRRYMADFVANYNFHTTVPPPLEAVEV